MQINVDDRLIQELVEAHMITVHHNVHSVEARAQIVARLQYHVMEQINAIVIKEFRKHKLIPHYKK